MKKRVITSLLAVAMLVSVIAVGFTGCGDTEGMTIVGTPRAETLIVETQNPTDTPGQFNPNMTGTSSGFGIHQLLWNHLWEMNTITGEQFGDIAVDLPTSNEDFTEHEVKIREGMTWSDGETLDAHDVAFSFTAIMENENHSSYTYFNQVFASVEATDDYTVKIVTNETFPRIALRFGVTIYGATPKIIPEHIYKDQDITTYPDSEPVVSGPYTVDRYDENGSWILYKLREDWQNTSVGIMEGQPQAQYILFQAFASAETRQLAMLDNNVDIMVEVTPEDYEALLANENVSAWYDGFPYATSDDPCSKGIAFSMGQGAPYDNADFRWAIALAMNFDEVSMNIFSGIGRSSPFPILTATAAMMETYYLPMLDWVKEFELDLGDGTTVKPFDDQYAFRMAEIQREKGHDIPEDEETIIDMFGIGCWKYDPESAEKLLIKAGLTKEADGWYFEGEPFVINMTYLTGTEPQAGRGTEAAYQQLTEFGLNCNLTGESSATWGTNGSNGTYEIAGYWPTGGITNDIYSQISGWANDLIEPIGTTGSGQGTRWDNQEATDIIHELSETDPTDPRSVELGTEFIKLAIEDMVFIGFHSGVKLVPTNSTYWTGYPTSEDDYNGPWWWWSLFKFFTPHITATTTTTA